MVSINHENLLILSVNNNVELSYTFVLENMPLIKVPALGKWRIYLVAFGSVSTRLDCHGKRLGPV